MSVSILETIISNQGGAIVRQIATSYNIDPETAVNVLGKVVPGLSQQVRQKAEDDSGLETLLGLLQGGQQERYLDNEKELEKPEAIDDGNAILAQLLGNKDNSRAMAASVASEVGISDSIVKKILPQAAALVMGSMSKQTQSGGALENLFDMSNGARPRPQPEATSMLASFLDRDNDGSVIDDVMGMAARMLFK